MDDTFKRKYGAPNMCNTMTPRVGRGEGRGGDEMAWERERGEGERLERWSEGMGAEVG